MHTLELNNQVYNIPENANELSLKKFIQIRNVIDPLTISGETMELTYNNIIDIVCITTGIDKDQILNYPKAFFDFVLDKILWVFSLKADDYPIKDCIIVDGVEYYWEDNPDRYLKEWVDIDFIQRNWPVEERPAGILCVRLRKRLEDGSLEMYDGDQIGERKDRFNECAVSEVLPLVNFFTVNDRRYEMLIDLYSKAVEAAGLNQMQLNNLVLNGDGTKPLSPWQMKIFSKSMKYLTNELKKHSTFLHTLSTSETPN